MTKAKTNALDALRALIAERQQYEQWISTLEAKREGTPEHVFERVRNDYRNRLERVVSEIKGYAEELQLSISTLSSRLVEVARDEDTRREGLQEAELRAAVGEYEPEEWEKIRAEGEQALAKIGADRGALDGQLGELRAIQKLSEIGPGESVQEAVAKTDQPAAPTAERSSPQAPQAGSSPLGAQPRSPEPRAAQLPPADSRATPSAAAPRAASVAPASQSTAATPATQERLPFEPVASAAGAAAGATARPRSSKTPPSGVAAQRSRTEAVKPDSAKTLKCPECGTANYPTEWYCERCGGELATM